MGRLTSLCLFCGSNVGDNPAFAEAADELGAAMAQSDVQLVYGGGHVGIMGVAAEAVMREGGRVVGFIPEHLTRLEAAYQGATELHVVENMHVRKFAMFERADAFVVFPGGFGTMDETFEILTWRQLGIHNKPIIIANIEGYWDPFLDLVDSMIARRFAKPVNRDLFTVVDDWTRILPTIEQELGRAGVGTVAADAAERL
ncbi:TIGR00730 family Rossman fold protein [Caenispirillum salinarum]|uniref:LOG family protein n=1 Tax=Caenispirillum salinarum TaxID=859058 RepID=UPI00384B830F